MHDIWNPWHGCVKCSEGCEHCYMYYLDQQRDMDGSAIYRTSLFRYPLQRERNGAYRVRSGEMLRVCMTSDFFLAEADAWRPEAWDIMRQRPDVLFYLLTKRPERVLDHLPPDWGDGWHNILFNVTCENQRRADERMPLLLSLPFRHKGVMCAPFVGEVHLAPYLQDGQVEQVICGGENYGGARPCQYAWVQVLYEECRSAQVKFTWIETGTRFIKDNRLYTLPDKRLQSRMAWKSGLRVAGRPVAYRLTDPLGNVLPESMLHHPSFGAQCVQCGSRPICNGCSHCGKCERSTPHRREK